MARLTLLELARASSRETVAGWILNNRAASAAVFVALGDHLSNLRSLLIGEFRSASAGSTLLAGRI